MRCVYTQSHLLHAPDSETEAGTPIPTYEVPRRAEIIRAALETDGGFPFLEPVEHGIDPVLAVHDPELVDYLAHAWERRDDGRPDAALIPDTIPHFALRAGMSGPPKPRSAAAHLGYFCFDTTTALVEGTYAAARAAVDVALTATDLVLDGESTAYGLCRPPGHHAARSVYGGYCFFNNAAVAAQYARGRGVGSLAVLDVDYHHGNGTQQIFYERGDVMYVSLHADPNRAYPYYTGYAQESGAGDGAGANMNLPLPKGCSGSQFLSALQVAIDEVATFGAEMVIVSLGVDTYRDDPIADFSLTTAHQHEMGSRVGASFPRLVVLQEGGYDVGSLGINVRAWLRGAEGRDDSASSETRTEAGSAD